MQTESILTQVGRTLSSPRVCGQSSNCARGKRGKRGHMQTTCKMKAHSLLFIFQKPAVLLWHGNFIMFQLMLLYSVNNKVFSFYCRLSRKIRIAAAGTDWYEILCLQRAEACKYSENLLGCAPEVFFGLSMLLLALL